MITKDLTNDAIEYAYSEIKEYGLPTILHFELSLQKAEEIAEKVKADINLVKTGVSLMDIKLGEAFKSGRLPEHVAMGVKASQEFLSKYNELSDEESEKIINCVQAHHGKVPFSCLEAQVTTDADAYRFIHPKGLLSYIATLGKRGLEFPKLIDQAEFKLEEKIALVSLDETKEELVPHYKAFKSLFAAAKD